MYGRKDDIVTFLTGNAGKTTPLTSSFSPATFVSRSSCSHKSHNHMKNSRSLIIITALCIAFWSIVAWSCHGAPGGTPSPPGDRGGQKKIWRPRGSDLQPAKKIALCLIQDPDQAKPILGIVQCARALSMFGNAHSVHQWGKFSPRIRSFMWILRRCCEAKEYLAVKKPRNQRHNRLLNTNWLVVHTQKSTG